MRRIAIIGLVFFSLIISFTAGCTAPTTEDELIGDIFASAEEMAGHYDDIDAQTRNSELIISLGNLISYSDEKIKHFNQMSFDDSDLEKIRDNHMAALHYSKNYALFTISYLETGDRNDLKMAIQNEELSNQILDDNLKLFIAYTQLHHPGLLPINQFKKDDLIQFINYESIGVDTEGLFLVDYYDEIEDTYHIYTVINSSGRYKYYEDMDILLKRDEAETKFRMFLPAEEAPQKNTEQ